MSTNDNQPAANFIRQIINNDLKENKHNGKVATRFPPEPNGYLHIGHAKSICLNFGIAAEYDGTCNLRFDDTNPEKESIEYMESIERDVRWLGFKWHELHHASDYFEQLYQYAVQLIEQGQAYVDSLSAEQIRAYRGTLTEPGKESPDRNRSIAENLDLFKRMRAGEFADGQYVLRAKIDMASPNINMRDPALYRIRRVHHHRTGDAWCIYPMYDYTHCISDAIEGITHSLCTLEFEDHRPLYDWVLDQLQTPCHPQQIEFARLQLEYTIVSKRKLNQLVMEKHVHGWDDPRMPTIAGLRRAGFTPKAIRDFCERIGLTKQNSWIEMGVLEYCIREDLNENALRAMAVLQPLRVVIDNYPEDKTEQLEISNHPQRPELGKRSVPFSKVVLIEQDDFAEIPPPKFKRLVTGGEVRLRGSYVIKCNEVIKDADGLVTELRCTYDPDTLGKNPEGRKVKGVIHWVSEQHAHPAEVRLYDRLFNVPNPDNEENFLNALNPDSLEVLADCRVEASLAQAQPENRYQFERTGYFCLDAVDSVDNKLVFNRTVTLREGWVKD
ncbi:MAG: glutamine--tRNA ligase/YqeY domain fusion protein [Methylococcaceae bacterium]|jgi:glutaminyl-tRNA synthetase|nr:glutamine--tRNA ligase/YqeY domain fusion protein [Methylococcaceae bacterium]MDD1629005.1 glutamine--tRNA ligase/YqeY domain fusion protein [Methylococcaceae bacterium]MDD1635036.1 glutamine--tRNA ligase/YqeY domain fusion protein [Methylococcaceae bacterium]MDD1640281.1 glutamine--tRNA ligase/YqeY domain fusion protein [Methylococcaceae bacterium]OYV23293.1 MAG: glutaminyl-tRNA synthetase [Methylococcaceae bacterium NSO1]